MNVRPSDHTLCLLQDLASELSLRYKLYEVYRELRQYRAAIAVVSIRQFFYSWDFSLKGFQIQTAASELVVAT